MSAGQYANEPITKDFRAMRHGIGLQGKQIGVVCVKLCKKVFRYSVDPSLRYR
jgi:hypothetical protein